DAHGEQHGGEGPDEPAILAALEAVAARAAMAARLEPPGGEAVLRSVVEAAVAVFNAEACSIALHEPETDRLVIRVAAGRQGAGAIGLSIAASTGIAGYVFSTGQPLAVNDVTADPRFDRATAETTGYVPRAILAVPILDESGSIGVLEVLDGASEGSNQLRDLTLASVFARQAATTVKAGRVERDTAELLRATLARLSADPDADAAAIEAAVGEIASHLDDEAGGRLWALADAVARTRHASPDQVGLVIEILDALARRSARPAARSFRR
ncbi:MAG TPA: GAF domain-containing protein, partial [Candidatus Limnocylindrales bacterium]|nr:GAF domain-containing protein [Candidatus Limnocylindrales bacterium]